MMISNGLWNPHVTGISVPMWSPQYRDFLVITIGLLAAMYDEERLRTEVAPQLQKLSAAVLNMSDSIEDNPFVETAAPQQSRKQPLIAPGGREKRNELEAGAGRTGAPPSLRAADGRPRQGQAAT